MAFCSWLSVPCSNQGKAAFGLVIVRICLGIRLDSGTCPKAPQSLLVNAVHMPKEQGRHEMGKWSFGLNCRGGSLHLATITAFSLCLT